MNAYITTVRIGCKLLLAVSVFSMMYVVAVATILLYCILIISGLTLFFVLLFKTIGLVIGISPQAGLNVLYLSAILSLPVATILTLLLAYDSFKIFILGKETSVIRKVRLTKVSISKHGIIDIADENFIAPNFSKASVSVANKLNSPPFPYLVFADRYYIGAMIHSKDYILVTDLNILKFLELSELNAVLAHEYGHFKQSLAIHRFLRRSYLVYEYLSFQEGDETYYNYKRIIKFLTLPIIVSGFRDNIRKILDHIPKVYSSTVSLFLFASIFLFRKEFHNSEYFADELSANLFGKGELARALLKLSALQLLRTKNFINSNQFEDYWTTYSKLSSKTHPSLRSRLEYIFKGEKPELFEYIHFNLEAIYNQWIKERSLSREFLNPESKESFNTKSIKLSYPQFIPPS